jgi:hypothetical protein
LETLSIASAVVSLLLAVCAIWLSIVFYRMSSASSDLIRDSAKDINAGVEKLEELFRHLYADTFSMMKDTVTDMRRHAWSNSPRTESSGATLDAVELRADVKVTRIREELADSISALADRVGGTDERVKELSEQLLPMVDQALTRSRHAEVEAREEILRDAILRRYAECTEEAQPTTTWSVVGPLFDEFSIPEVIDELRRMKEDGILQWDSSYASPRTSDTLHLDGGRRR